MSATSAAAPARWNRDGVVSLTVVSDRPDAIALAIDACHWGLAKLAESGITASLSLQFPEDDPEG